MMKGYVWLIITSDLIVSGIVETDFYIFFEADNTRNLEKAVVFNDQTPLTGTLAFIPNN